MSVRTIGSDGLDEPRRDQYAFESQRMKIRREWHDITGTDVPDRIEMLPITEQLEALEFQRRKYQKPSSETGVNDDSLQFEDNHNNLK